MRNTARAISSALTTRSALGPWPVPGSKRSSACRIAARRSRRRRTNPVAPSFMPSIPTSLHSRVATALTRRSTAVRVMPKSAATDS
jgi:hypothetical protein